MSLIHVLKFRRPVISPDLSALEVLECIGEVEVSKRIISGATTVGVAVGDYNNARLQVWGEGVSISDAAEKCLAKLVETGLVDVPLMLEARKQ